MEKQEIRAVIESLGLSVVSEFVPWSKSRINSEDRPSLNWKVTVKRDGRDVLTTDYSAGMAHCPAYDKIPAAAKAFRNNLCMKECEEGFEVYVKTPIEGRINRQRPIKPDSVDVFYSLTLDSDVLNYGTFEDWASEFGYDPDSRSAESTYRACLEIALKLRVAIGEDGLERLREAFQDY